jgi:hypothetical protein
VIVYCTRFDCKTLNLFLYSFVKGNIGLGSALAPEGVM